MASIVKSVGKFDISGDYNNCILKYRIPYGTEEDEKSQIKKEFDETVYEYSDFLNEYKWTNSEALNIIYKYGLENDQEFRNIYPCYKFDYILTRSEAVPPTRAHGSDTGFDLTIIDVMKTFGNVTLYTTGVKVKPGSGFYFDLVPRSSISKLGYMMANSIGIIDQSYTGEILVALVKIDDKASDIKLPCKIAQLVPRPWMNSKGVKVSSFEETQRGSGGFGSTGV